MITYRIEDMTCGGCVRAIRAAVARVAPAAAVHADVGTRGVSVEGALDAAAVDAAIAANPDVAERIRDGKVQAAGALIGAVMKEMRGQADAGRVRELILAKLAQV